jgi:hypothetical protein
MQLELNMKAFSEALESWQLANQLGVDSATTERYRPAL